MTRSATADAAQGEALAWLKLRHKPPGQAESRLVQLHLTKLAWPALANTDAELRFAVAVAAWGQWLCGGTQMGDYGPKQIAALAHDARSNDRYGHRAKFERIVSSCRAA